MAKIESVVVDVKKFSLVVSREIASDGFPGLGNTRERNVTSPIIAKTLRRLYHKKAERLRDSRKILLPVRSLL